jgi:hypothetical protein
MHGIALIFGTAAILHHLSNDVNVNRNLFRPSFPISAARCVEQSTASSMVKP